MFKIEVVVARLRLVPARSVIQHPRKQFALRWLVVSPENHSPDQSTSIRVRFGMRVPVEEGVAAAEAAAVLPPRRRPGPVGTDLSVVRGCGGPCGHKLEADASAKGAP